MIRFQGFYRLRLNDRNRPAYYDTGWIPNLITDPGMDRLGLGRYLDHCAVGDGSADVAYTDQQLGSQRAVYDSCCAEAGWEEQESPYAWQRRTFLFSSLPRSFTLSEVGVGWSDEDTSEAPACASSSSSSESCYDHPHDVGALQLFSHINVTPFAVLARQQLEVIYELRMYPELEDDVRWLPMDDEYLVQVTTRPAYLGTRSWVPDGDPVQLSVCDPAPTVFDGSIGTILSGPTGDALECSASRSRIYAPDSYRRVLEAFWPPYSRNFEAGVGSVLFYSNGYGAWQAAFDPPLRDRECYEKLVTALEIRWARRAVGSSSSSSSSSGP